LGAKHVFLRAGFGFGYMPMFMVQDDIASDRLRAVRTEMSGATIPLMRMHAVYRKEAPPGPAGRWLIQNLKRRAGTESLKKTDGAKHKRAARR
jgi:DNA-binding transcriptional LysR family regulator